MTRAGGAHLFSTRSQQANPSWRLPTNQAGRGKVQKPVPILNGDVPRPCGEAQDRPLLLLPPTVPGSDCIASITANTTDYTRKGGVICSDILLPSHAPPEYADRQTLGTPWKKAERWKERPARNSDIALQNEFSLEENIALRQFLLENAVA